MLDTNGLKNFLSQPRRIVITTHHKPDGDAMGSCLGLYAYLAGVGHQVTVVTPTDYPKFLHWLPNNERVKVFTDNIQLCAQYINNAEIVFCLDFNRLTRINELGKLIELSSAKKALIDHHLEPENFADFILWDTTACSTAQLVYRFICELMADRRFITPFIATCLYTGIMTDSAQFTSPTTTSDVHRIVADLIDLGADNYKINHLVNDNVSENRLRFLGYCLSNKLEVLNEYNTAVITASQAELRQFNIITGETEGIVNYALSIENIRLAAFIVDRGELIKLSLRSKGDFPANEVCKKYFNGGGHFNAAGGTSTDSLEHVVNQFKLILPEYKKLLIK